MTTLISLVLVVRCRLGGCLDDRLDRLRSRARVVPNRAGWHAGQATAEYALVLLGVAAIALLLAAWAAKSGKVGQLFDAVIDQLIKKAR
jgi:hypothetical protein